MSYENFLSLREQIDAAKALQDEAEELAPLDESPRRELVQRSADDDGLHHKDDALVPPSTTEIVRSHIDNFRREMFAELNALADDAGATEGGLRKALDRIDALEQAVAELEDAVDELRTENEVLRSIVRGDLPTLKRSA